MEGKKQRNVSFLKQKSDNSCKSDQGKIGIFDEMWC
jgi:hypothetical protein